MTENDAELSKESRSEVESIRQKTNELLGQISALQGGWNHGARARDAIDGAQEHLKDAGAKLEAL